MQIQAFFLTSRKGSVIYAKTLERRKPAPSSQLKDRAKGRKGKGKGTVAIQPGEVDAILREALATIYAGNIADKEEATKRYIWRSTTDSYTKHQRQTLSL